VNKPQLFLVEGIRSPWEVNIFKKNFKDFKVIAVHSKPETRFFRLKKRMRSDDSADSKESMERDQRELKFGIGEVIVNSDFMVVNEGSLNKFKKTVQRIIENEL
jgi:dephospho-CoA kinase